MILHCDCKANSSGNTAAASYQDKLYGFGKRVHNPLPKQQNAPQKGRCTVCGRENTAPAAAGEVASGKKGKR